MTETGPYENLLSTLAARDGGDPRPTVLLSPQGTVVAANAAGQILARRWQALGTMPDSLDTAIGQMSPYEYRHLADTNGAAGLICLPVPDDTGDDAIQLFYMYRTDAVSRIDEALTVIRRTLVHDLRTPLQALIASLDDNDAGRSAAEQMLREIAAILAIEETPGMLTAQEAFNPAVLVNEVLATMQPLCQKRGTALSFALSQAPPVLLAPVALVRLLFQNLVGNAVSHGTGDVRVELSCELTAPGRWRLVFRVSQQGAPFPEPLLRWLARGIEPDRGIISPGTGMRLIRAAGVVLEATWHAFNQGDAAGNQGDASGVAVSFTLAEASGALVLSSAPTLPGEADGLLADRNILVIEDSAVTRDWLVRVLRQSGATVGFAADGRGGLMLAETATPAFDLVLLDLVLPELDGLAVTRRLRSTTKGEGPVIVALTGHSDEATKRTCLRAGVTAVLTKPVLATDLRRELARLLRGQDRKEKTMTDQHLGVEESGAEPLFSTTIIRELVGDLGQSGARQFILRAIDEADATLASLRQHGFGEITRPQIHSSVGSSGITGLRRIENCLRAIQVLRDRATTEQLALTRLQHSIVETRAAISRGEPFSAL